jgi:hypothetical protein
MTSTQRRDRLLPWNLLETVFNQMRDACAAGRFVPLLAGDVAAYIYGATMQLLSGDAKRLHLGARVVGVPHHERYAFVIGDMRRCAGERAAVQPELAIETARFIDVRTKDELYQQIDRALRGLQRLQLLRNICPHGRGLVVFDDEKCVGEQQVRSIADTQAKSYPGIFIFLFQSSNRGLQWRIVRDEKLPMLGR